MFKKSFSKLLLTALAIMPVFTKSYSQFPYNIVDQRGHPYCEPCQDSIYAKPKEVLFGIQIMRDGSVYFSMDNIQWFNKIFKNDSYGVTADLVSKKRYSCGTTTLAEEEAGLPRGNILLPVYRRDLLNGNESPDGNM